MERIEKAIDSISRLAKYVSLISDDLKQISDRILSEEKELSRRLEVLSYEPFEIRATETFVSTHIFYGFGILVSGNVIEKDSIVRLEKSGISTTELTFNLGNLVVALAAIKKGYFEVKGILRGLRETLLEENIPILDYVIVEKIEVGKPVKEKVDADWFMSKMKESLQGIKSEFLMAGTGVLYGNSIYERIWGTIYGNSIFVGIEASMIGEGGKAYYDICSPTIDLAPKLAETVAKQIVKYSEYVYG